MCQLKSLPLHQMLTHVYPDLYPVHTMSEKGALDIDDQVRGREGKGRDGKGGDGKGGEGKGGEGKGRGRGT